MRGSSTRWLSALSLSLVVCSASCSDDDKKKTSSDAAVPDGDGSMPETPDSPLKPQVSCDDKEADLYAAQANLPDARGAILRCVDDGFIPQAGVQKRLDALESGKNTYQGAAASGGAHLYRVLYKTERGKGQPATSVATLVVPQKPRAEKLPLMLMARGSRGQAPNCAPSRLMSAAERDKVVTIDSTDNQDGRYVQDDYEALLWPLVAAGFAVVATDSAGYANFGAAGNPPSGYAQLEDMGKSFIDSAFALQNFAGDAVSDDVLMVGLSQGGHTVLGSLQVANEYAAPGPIKGAAVYAPLWVSQRGWGLTMDTELTKLYKLSESSTPAVVSIWYHYTHAELLDGPGEGLKLFKPQYQEAVKTFVEKTCWSSAYDGLMGTGAQTVREIYDDAFAAAASSGAALKDCTQADDTALCQKWLDRYEHDRPTLTGEAAKVPLLVSYGLMDTTLPHPFMQCVVDKLSKAENKVEYCVDPKAGHAGVVLTQSTFVNEWLSEKALGTKIEAKCPQMAAPSGSDFECNPIQLRD